jgi:hypothetical protein
VKRVSLQAMGGWIMEQKARELQNRIFETALVHQPIYYRQLSARMSHKTSASNLVFFAACLGSRLPIGAPKWRSAEIWYSRLAYQPRDQNIPYVRSIGVLSVACAIVECELELFRCLWPWALGPGRRESESERVQGRRPRRVILSAHSLPYGQNTEYL